MVGSVYLRRYVDDFLDLAMPELPAFMITGPRGCGNLLLLASVVTLSFN